MTATSADRSDIAKPNIDKTGGAWRTVEAVEACRAKLHKQPFRVGHELASDPLFDIDRLVGVAASAAHRPGDLTYDMGDASVDSKWGEIDAKDQTLASLGIDQIIHRIETAKAWIIMKHVELDPAYGQVLGSFADFVRDIAGPKGANLIRNPEMLILVTSPHRVTPCHFDAETNFLVQARGWKHVWICDPADREITTEEELEYYYNASANVCNFKPFAEERAQKFELRAGDAVHIPSHGAHWVKNSDQVSVSLSLNFELPDWVHKDFYRCNYHLRRLGFAPKPPGVSSVPDAMKLAIGAAWRGARAVKALAGGITRRS